MAKDDDETSTFSISSLPLLEENDYDEYNACKPPSKTRRLFRQLLWPTVLHGVILLVYTSLIVLGFERWLAQRDCHKPLIYSMIPKSRSTP